VTRQICQRVVEHVAARTGAPPFAAVGFSLGGNVLLKWLGERGAEAPLRTAVAVSVPFLLGEAADRMERGWSRLYQTHLVGRLRASYARKFQRIALGRCQSTCDGCGPSASSTTRSPRPCTGSRASTTTTADRAAGSSSSAIRVPTLIVHARDDPFMWPRTVPSRGELSESVQLEVTEHGGHVGFVAGRWPVATAVVAGRADRRAPRRASRQEFRSYPGWISRFISATASARPVNSARAMIEWPMLSSRTPSIAATAFTLW